MKRALHPMRRSTRDCLRCCSAPIRDYMCSLPLSEPNSSATRVGVSKSKRGTQLSTPTWIACSCETPLVVSAPGSPSCAPLPATLSRQAHSKCNGKPQHGTRAPFVSTAGSRASLCRSCVLAPRRSPWHKSERSVAVGFLREKTTRTNRSCSSRPTARPLPR